MSVLKSYGERDRKTAPSRTYKLSGSRSFYDTLIPLHKKIQKYRMASVQSKSRAAASVEEHRLVFEAIASGDCLLAEKYAKEHVNNAYKHIVGKDN